MKNLNKKKEWKSKATDASALASENGRLMTRHIMKFSMYLLLLPNKR